jgi:vacuolar-type H+-ATPase subunit E/Vma4
LDPNIHGTLKPRRGTRHHTTFTLIERRLADITDRYSLDMQNVRFQLILELRALAEMAQQKAIDTHPAKDDVKQNWIRLTAYIGQVINALGKTYEEIKTDEDLKTLENAIRELKGEKPQEPQQ